MLSQELTLFFKKKQSDQAIAVTYDGSEVFSRHYADESFVLKRPIFPWLLLSGNRIRHCSY